MGEPVMAKRKAFLLRVDPRLHDAMRRWAEDDFRSLNAQIELVLRQVLIAKGRLGKDAPMSEEERSGKTETPEQEG